MVIGTIGLDIPDELLVAAKAQSVRIEGEPGGPTDLADRYVEQLLDSRTRSQLQRILDGTYSTVDLLLLCHDSDRSVRLFYTLREIKRLERERLPQALYFFDFLHLRRPTSNAWNRARMADLRRQLGDPSDDAIHAAIRTCNDRRRRVHVPRTDVLSSARTTSIPGLSTRPAIRLMRW